MKKKIPIAEYPIRLMISIFLPFLYYALKSYQFFCFTFIFFKKYLVDCFDFASTKIMDLVNDYYFFEFPLNESEHSGILKNIFYFH